MKKPLFVAITALIVGSGFACQPQPGDQPPVQSPQQQRDSDPRDTIDDEEQKVNDSTDLNQGDPEGECPAPEPSDQMCAQVIVWALSPDGVCCEYPTPCHAPKSWETFPSEQNCRDAADELE